MTSAPPIRRILAPNPSPLTGTGTNTWLLGATSLAVIDPGPDNPMHLKALLAAVGPGQRIDDIVVTHAHRDHSELARRLADATGATIHAFGPATAGRSAMMTALAGSLSESGEGLDHAFAPDIPLADGQRLHGPDWELTALHTPGHLGGHLCLALGDLLFSGDHVMGWSTSIVSPPDGDMGDYLASLHRLRDQSWRRFLPGHGDPVEAPGQRVEELIAHRRKRESEILRAVESGLTQIAAITAAVYADTRPELLPAAERNVFAHLIDLAARNLVSADPALHPAARFTRL